MDWRGRRESDNVEDQRGMQVPRGAKIGGIGGLGMVVLVVLGLFLGIDPSVIFQMNPPTQSPQMTEQKRSPMGSPAQDELRKFVSVVLAETEDVWNEAFAKSGSTYKAPKLVLFSQAVDSACGFAQSAMGPFYCPMDNKVYLDLSFFDDLQRRFGASGDFAQAYVIAHEVGHHVQTLLGITQKVDDMRRRRGGAQANNLSVRLELQADCLSGVWAHRAHKSHKILEPGDIEEALNAASAIGDDRIQKKMQGRVVPDSFTHGSSEQRVRWFRRGLDEGDLRACNTFAADRL